MGLYTITREQRLPISIQEAWAFISAPSNLSVITPDYMDFKITSGNENEKIYPGMIITYKVKPLAGIALNWVTEISHSQEHKYFIDEQRFGPYKFWHHAHFLKPTETGVLMKDIVNYSPPLGFIGSIANSLFIRKQLKGIFDYRFNKLEELFGKVNATS